MLRSTYSMLWLFAGGDAPCLLARGRLSAAGSLVGLLVQLQRVKVPGVLVTIGLARVSPAAAPLQDASALLGGRGLQVCQNLPVNKVSGACKVNWVRWSTTALIASACCWRPGAGQITRSEGLRKSLSHALWALTNVTCAAGPYCDPCAGGACGG